LRESVRIGVSVYDDSDLCRERNNHGHLRRQESRWHPCRGRAGSSDRRDRLFCTGPTFRWQSTTRPAEFFFLPRNKAWQ